MGRLILFLLVAMLTSMPTIETLAQNQKPKKIPAPHITPRNDASKKKAEQEAAKRRQQAAAEKKRQEEATRKQAEEQKRLTEQQQQQTKPLNQIPLSNRTFTVNGVTFVMVGVTGGTFKMGNDNGDGDEKPVHSVALSSYYIGKTEVTQALWTAVMGNNPSYHKGNNLPVEQVSWDDCLEFIKKLNELTNENFRLPTEAEWEFAARGGIKSRSYIYSGSNKIEDVAWYYSNCDHETHPVATKAPNELGIYDMSGNVWEWCYDWYAYYPDSVQINPTGPTLGSYRIARGGSWNYDEQSSGTTYRFNDTPVDVFMSIGLRLALSK